MIAVRSTHWDTAESFWQSDLDRSTNCPLLLSLLSLQKDARVCAQLFCFDSASGYCVSYRPAAEGSACGDGQVRRSHDDNHVKEKFALNAQLMHFRLSTRFAATGSVSLSSKTLSPITHTYNSRSEVLTAIRIAFSHALTTLIYLLPSGVIHANFGTVLHSRPSFTTTTTT